MHACQLGSRVYVRRKKGGRLSGLYSELLEKSSLYAQRLFRKLTRMNCGNDDMPITFVLINTETGSESKVLVSGDNQTCVTIKKVFSKFQFYAIRP